MKRFKILMTVVCILAAASIVSAQQRTVYVSSSIGEDSSDGSTPEKPVKNFWRAMQLNPSAIRLKCGDVFYRSLSVDGCDIGSYGEGDKPMICGLKILTSDAWTRGVVTQGRWQPSKSGDVWRASLCDDNSAYEGYNVGGRNYINNVGQIIDCATDSSYVSMRVPTVDDLTEDFDFTLAQADGSLSGKQPQDFDFIFVKAATDLNKLRIGLAAYSNGVEVKNATVSGIRVCYWGRHGIAGGSNTTVSDCEISRIGGSWFASYPYEWVVFGNGIEFYVTPSNVENVVVEYCTIDHCVDCGLTVQGSSDTESIMAKNVVFRNNLVENCGQSFEFFLRGATDADLFYDCECAENLSIDAGIDTGFRDYRKRYKRCHFLDNSSRRRTNMKFVRNTLVNGNYYCAGKCDDRYDQSIWVDNVCYIKRGQHLIGNYNGNADVVEMPTEKGAYPTLQAATDAAIARYRSLTSDLTTAFYIIDE